MKSRSTLTGDIVKGTTGIRVHAALQKALAVVRVQASASTQWTPQSSHSSVFNIRVQRHHYSDLSTCTCAGFAL